MARKGGRKHFSCLSFFFYTSLAQAAVQGVGDVTPQQIFTDVPFGFGDEEQLVDITAPDLPFSGGRIQVSDGMDGMIAAALVVGGTGVFSGTTLEDGTQIGTTTGSVTINSPTNTLPLIAGNVIIGMRSNGRGRITLTDFGATLIAENELIIGEEGEGELRVFNGARVGVGIYDPDPTSSKYENGTTTLGKLRDTSGSDQYLSQGFISIDGFGTQFETEELIIAEEGRGTIEISGKGRLSTINTTLGIETGSVGRLTLSGLGTRWTNSEDLVVGDNGSGLIEVNNLAVLVSETITVGITSFVDLNGGTLISNSTLANGGILRGNGRIESDLSISGSGQLRNYGVTGVSNPSESLLITGTVSNRGTIESLGGEMEFQSPVTNDREIVARDTTLYFRAGLINNGSLSIGGNTELHGNINSAGGIFVLSDSESLIVGDLVFTASAVLGLTIGEDAGTLDVTGSAMLTDAIITLDYSAGIASQPGDTYQIFQANGGITGTFSPIAAADGRLWDISLSGTDTLIATALGVALPTGADFNGDGFVNALDLTIWRDNYPIAAGAPKELGDADGDGDVDGADFMKIQRDLGVLPVPPISAATSVPEPSTLALALLTLLCCPRRRSKRRKALGSTLFRLDASGKASEIGY